MRVLFDPTPREADQIFSPEDLASFRGQYQVTEWQGQDRAALYAAELPRTEVLISQQPMDADRLALAPNLRAIFNVETNFLPNIGHDACFGRGIHMPAAFGGRVQAHDARLPDGHLCRPGVGPMGRGRLPAGNRSVLAMAAIPTVSRGMIDARAPALIARGLPRVACRRAERETVAMLRSKPVDRS